MPSTEGTTTTHLACYPAHLDLPPAHVFLLFPISPARISVSNIRHPGGTERLYCVTGSERRPNRPSVKPFSAGSAPGHNRVPRAPPRGPVNRTRVTRSALTPPADRHRRARRKGTAARRARPGGARQSTPEHDRARPGRLAPRRRHRTLHGPHLERSPCSSSGGRMEPRRRLRYPTRRSRSCLSWAESECRPQH